MAGIFISYRRADSDGWAGRLRDALRVRFGDVVFQDVDNVADGEIFSDVIDRALQLCDVALIIIGPTWASASDEHGRRRLDLEDDWVRTETGMVLNRKIRVIPVLVGGARLPRADDLPEELRSLTKRQAREIRSTSWDSDVAQLSSHLEQIVGRPRRKLWLYTAPALVVAAAGGVFFGSRFFGAPDTTSIAEGVALAPAVPKTQPADSRPPGVTQPHDPEKRQSEPDISAEKGRGPILADAEKGRASAAAAEKTERSVVSAPTKSPSGAQDSSATAESAAKPQASSATRTQAHAQPEPIARSSEAPPRRAAKEASADAQPPAAKPTPVAPKVAAVPPEPAVQPGRRVAPAASTWVNPDPPPARRSEVASAPAATQQTPPTPQPSTGVARAAEAAAEAPGAARSSPASAPGGTGVTAETVARLAPISFPNRPSSARELKVGDSWTYRLRDLAYNREPTTATHEVRGGDASGIREVIHVGERRSDGDSGGTQRRLPLEARMFEQPIQQSVVLFEFAPFLIAFSDVRPGLAWSEIPVGGSDGWRMSGKVTGHERVRTPAGTFEAIKVELEGLRDIPFPTTRETRYETSPSRMTYAIWFVPEIGRAVKYDRRTFNRGLRLLDHEQYELVSYRLK